nr:3'-5' exonuclease [uncultured Clostridium sp.]
MALNREQLTVINELNENIMLLASAGTGKTETLARRVANIIETKKALGDEILCITFTNKACKEMKERVEQIVGAEGNKVKVSTFHSFCFDIIKQQAKKRTDIFTDFVVFDEDDCIEIIKTCNYFNFPIPLIQRFLDFIKLERARRDIYSEDEKKDYEEVVKLSFKENEEKINSLCSDRGNINLNLNLKKFLKEKGHILINSYNGTLRNNHAVDFADIIVSVKELFKDEQLIETLKIKYKYINIDEVQDTSLLEYSIIEKIFANNNILICGDIFQTIYKWRGSEPDKIFDKFKNKYKPKEIIFVKNYRATKNLTEASLSYLKNAFENEVNEIYKEEIKAFTEAEGEKIKYKALNSSMEEARFIVDEIRRLQAKGEDLNKIAVLTRNNRYNVELSRNIENILSREGADFSFALVDQFRFFRRQEIKDIIAFLKIIGNKNDAISLKRIVKRLPTGVGDKAFEAIESDEYKSIGISLCDYIDENTVLFGEKYGLLINEFENNNIIVFDVESTGVDVTEDEIIQIAAIKINKYGEVTEKFEKFLKNKKSVKSSEHVHGFSDKFLRENGEDKEVVLKEFIEFSKDAIIVGHNVQFDINILTSELSRLNLGKVKFKGFFDTLDIYKRFYSNLPNHKLDTLSRIFETVNKPSHDAMDDILATKELLVMAIKNKIKPTSLERIAHMSKHMKAFTAIRNKLNALFIKAESLRPCDIVAEVINGFSIKTLYPGEEGREKIERLRDFYMLLKELDEEEKSNRDALMEIIKITALSNGDLEALIINRSKFPKIPIITVHQSKGLEYDTVFLAGLKENTFPSYMSVKANNIDEEKRTFYVAITRAKKRLYMTCSLEGAYGRRGEESRFIKLIDDKYLSN